MPIRQPLLLQSPYLALLLKYSAFYRAYYYIYAIFLLHSQRSYCVRLFNISPIPFTLALSLVISGCATLPDEKSIQSRAEQSTPSKKSANDALQSAKLNIRKAESENLSFYAPSYYTKAKTSFDKAKSVYAKDNGNQEAKLNAYLSTEYVKAGIRNKKVTKDTLKQSLNSRKVLTQLSAQKHFPARYNELELEQIEIIKLIEQRDLNGAKSAQKDLIKKMRALEVKAIDYEFLAKTHTMLQQANELNAKELLPRTYQKTIDNLADTQQFIRQNPRQKLRIEELADASLFQAERLYSLTRYAKKMRIAQENQLEQFVLKQEEQLDRINQAFKHTNITNLSFNDQSLLLKEQANNALEDIHSYQSKGGKVSKAQLDKWKRKTVLLQAEVRRLQKALKTSQAKN
jgi:hypothetical protein